VDRVPARFSADAALGPRDYPRVLPPDGPVTQSHFLLYLATLVNKASHLGDLQVVLLTEQAQ